MIPQQQQPFDPNEGLRREQASIQEGGHQWTEQEAGIAFTQAFLEGQEYRPSPTIVPDNRVGFDETGNWHAIEHFNAEALNNVITPHRWADYLQDALTSYIATFDYTVGASERDDIVQDIVAERMEQVDSTLEALQLEKALEIWRQRYRYGIRP